MATPYDDFLPALPLPPMYDAATVNRLENIARAPFRARRRAKSNASDGPVPALPSIHSLVTPRAGQGLGELSLELLEASLNGDGIGLAGGSAATSPRVGVVGPVGIDPVRIVPGTGRGANRVPAPTSRASTFSIGSHKLPVAPHGPSGITAGTSPVTPAADRRLPGAIATSGRTPNPTGTRPAGPHPTGGATSAPPRRTANSASASKGSVPGDLLKNPTARLALSLLGFDKAIRQFSDVVAKAHPNDPDGFKKAWAPIKKQIVATVPKGANAAAKVTCDNCAKEKSTTLQQDLDAAIANQVGDLADFYAGLAAVQERKGDALSANKSREQARRASATKAVLEKKIGKPPDPPSADGPLSPETRDTPKDAIVRVANRDAGPDTKSGAAHKDGAATNAKDRPTVESVRRTNADLAVSRARSDLRKSGRNVIERLPANHPARALVERWDLLNPDAKRKAVAEYREWIKTGFKMPIRRGGRSGAAAWRNAVKRRQFLERIGDNLEKGESGLVALALAWKDTTLGNWTEDYLAQAIRDGARARRAPGGYIVRNPNYGKVSASPTERPDQKYIEVSREKIISKILSRISSVKEMSNQEYNKFVRDLEPHIAKKYFAIAKNIIQEVRNGDSFYWSAQEKLVELFIPETRLQKIVRMTAEAAPLLGTGIGIVNAISAAKRAAIAFKAGDTKEGTRQLDIAGIEIIGASGSAFAAKLGLSVGKAAARPIKKAGSLREYVEHLSVRHLEKTREWTQTVPSALEYIRKRHGPKQSLISKISPKSRAKIRAEYKNSKKAYRQSKRNKELDLDLIYLHAPESVKWAVRGELNRLSGMRWQDYSTARRRLKGEPGDADISLQTGNSKATWDQVEVVERKIFEDKAGGATPTRNQKKSGKKLLQQGWRITINNEKSLKKRKKLVRKRNKRRKRAIKYMERMK